MEFDVTNVTDNHTGRELILQYYFDINQTKNKMINFFTGTQAYENLTGASFKEKFMRTSHAELIDVRTNGEFAGGTIRGAKNIDFMSASFRDEFLKLDKEKEYFLFCRSGGRSAQACNILSKEGYKVTNLAGGIGSWPF